MSELYSSDNAMSGVWRAYVVKPLSDGSAHIFIPTLHRGLMPFIDISSPSSGIVEGCETSYPVANESCWKVRTSLKTGDVVWVTFENANARHPIILGNFGSMVDIVQPGQGGGGYGGTYSNVEGINENENFYKIYNYLSSLGFNMAAICGMLGNMKCENSNFDPALDVPDSGGTRAIGICMFNTGGAGGANYSNLKAHCGSYAYNSLEGQLEFLKYEFFDAGSNARSVKAAAEIMKVENSQAGAYEACRIFCQKYEVCAGREYLTGNYQNVLNKFNEIEKDSSKFDSAAKALTTSSTNVAKRGLWTLYYYECFSKAPVNEDGTVPLNIDNTNLTEKQKKVINFGRTFKGSGNSAESGYCQAWVADVYSKALGVSRASRGHASEAGRDWGRYRIEGFPDYTDRSKLKFSSTDLPTCKLSQVPIGATVYALWSGNSGYSGHVAIYVGDGKWLGNHGGSIPSTKTLQAFADKGYKGFVWGWNGNESLL